MMRHDMDRKKLYHPVFCLTEVPDAVSIMYSELIALT